MHVSQRPMKSFVDFQGMIEVRQHPISRCEKLSDNGAIPYLLKLKMFVKLIEFSILEVVRENFLSDISHI